jgi:cysteine sulfinate desulfinase/cysteine desulfurase-like protein
VTGDQDLLVPSVAASTGSARHSGRTDSSIVLSAMDVERD